MITQNAAPVTIRHSSIALGWEDVVVEHAVLQGDELTVSDLGDDRICMILDADFKLEQTRNGTSFVHTFARGQAQLLPFGTSGIWRYRQPANLLHVQFDPRFIQRIAPSELIDQFLLHDPQVEYISLALYAEMLDGGHNGSLYVSSLATALASHLLRKYGSTSISPAVLRLSPAAQARVLDYIEAHLADDIDLTTLAQIVNVSTSHFASLFKQSVGVAPYQYLLSRRVHRARDLLLHSGLSIAQVAAEVGFYDQSHLTRHMRRVLAITPAALQRQRIVPNRR